MKSIATEIRLSKANSWRTSAVSIWYTTCASRESAWLVFLEEIGKAMSKLRNQVIGRVFHKLALFGQWRSGIQRICATTEAGRLLKNLD